MNSKASFCWIGFAREKLQNKNPSFRLGEQTHSTLARTTVRGWFDSFFCITVLRHTVGWTIQFNVAG
jgi:hypothetical protein